MPEYSYQASSEDGQPATGELSAETVAAAVAALEARGLRVESISLTSVPLHRSPSGRASGLRSEHSMLDRQFETVMARREALIPALDALASEMPAGRARVEIRQLASLLGKAQSGAELRRERVVVQWLPLLATGFSAESSTEQLSELIANASRESQNRSERRRLLAYPLVVMLIALIVFASLCALVVPTFGSMFDEFQMRLPASTRMVVFVSDQLLHHPLRFAVVVGLTAVGIYGLIRWWTHYALTTRFMGTFVAGNSAGVSAMASLTSQLAELLSIGVSLSDALWIAGHGCRHHHFKKAAEHLARFAHDSARPLSESPDARYLPANVIHALQAGPHGEPSVGLLRGLSAMYGDRVSERVDWSTGATAQFAIVVVGFAVAFVVIAMFSPLIFLVTSLS